MINMPKAEDFLLPDTMIPELETPAEPFDFEEELPDEDEVDEAVVSMIEELLSYPIVTIEDLLIGLEEDEFNEKYQKYKARARTTGFSKNLARYMDEMGIDWMNDPRIALALSALMYFGFVAIDFKQTMDKKKKQKKIEERMEQAVPAQPIQPEGGEEE